MCCGITILALLGPRLTAILWWLLKPAYFSETFTTILWPLLGVIFLPWFTLMYLLVASGGISGFDMFLLIIALLLDISSYGGSVYSNKARMSGN